MRVTTYGTRGSYPVCRREVVRYGGNTTCWLVEAGEDLVIIDGGSGIVSLGNELCARYPKGRKVHLCMTHPHWDHVMGLPFFAPFHVAGFEIEVHGADSEDKPLDRVLETQHKPKSFPVAFKQLAAKITFDRLTAGETRALGAVGLKSVQLNHPGVDLGYRFETARGTFVIFTDLAPIADNHLGAGMAERADGRQKAFEDDYTNALVEMVRGADLVSYDTNFTDQEIQGRAHWGHSTPTHAIDLLANLDEPPAVVLSHHDPDHTDDEMDAIYADAQEQGRDRGVEVLVAKERGVLKL